MQSKEIIATLKTEDAKSFIIKNLNTDLSSLGLTFSGKTTFNITVCLQLMAIYKKAKDKLPLFVENVLAIDSRSYEQATSQKVAEYKRRFISGNTLIDLTAGIGVDSLVLSSNFKRIIAVERNEELHNLACYNLEQLRIENITRICGHADEHVTHTADWVYIDPDRRPGEKRAVKLESLEPNVLELLPKLRENCSKAYIKLSPLFDLDEVWRVFTDAERIVVLAENNEVKEVGVILNFRSNISTKTTLLADVKTGFSFVNRSDEPKQYLNTTLNERNYLIVPNALLTKSRLAEDYLSRHALEKHHDFGYFYSEVSSFDLGFKTFKILEVLSFNANEIKSNLKTIGVDQINIIIKGLNDKPAKWHDKLKTRDGGNFYLFLFKGRKKEALLAKLISS